ncbi:MAG: hypothetical protein K1X31_09915 [Gemmatimonadaceae bacterium]|nr:hypothetical protein [Gemmatimonadaceae bacterium]
MPPAMRSFIAVIGGMVIALTVGSMCDLVAGRLHPVPEGFDLTNAEMLRAHAAAAPTGALLVVALGWLLGPFAGGLVATRIAEHNRPLHAYAIAGILFAATLSNLMRIPHPFWMTFAAVFGIPFAGWLAVRFAPTDGPAA